METDGQYGRGPQAAGLVASGRPYSEIRSCCKHGDGM